MKGSKACIPEALNNSHSNGEGRWTSEDAFGGEREKEWVVMLGLAQGRGGGNAIICSLTWCLERTSNPVILGRRKWNNHCWPFLHNVIKNNSTDGHFC